MGAIFGIIIRTVAAIASGWVASDVFNESNKAKQNNESFNVGSIFRTKNIIIVGVIIAAYYYLTKNKQV
jgi:hypothetical protein